MLALRYDPDPILTQVSSPVISIDADLRQFIDQMILAMYEEQGAGLAACQVGRSIQLFVMDNITGFTSEGKILRGDPFVLINPTYTFKSPEQEEMKEGCLSFPGRPTKILRHKTVSVRALDAFGESFVLRATDFMAQCIQHEVDHLMGKTIHPISA